MREVIDEFMSMKTFAVFGASGEPDHPGYQLVKRLSLSGRRAFPINPRIAKVDGMRCYGTLDELPGVPQVVVIALRPEPTLEVFKHAITHGVRRFWLQPGSESPELLRIAEANGVRPMQSLCLLEQLDGGN